MKVGLAVITCNREDFFKRTIASIPDVDAVVVVNDGAPYCENSYGGRVSELIQHKRNKGIAASKNDALKALVNMGCDHIFLCEDDIEIVDPSVCEKYIALSEATGIYHLNFGYHGPRNKTETGEAAPRKVIKAAEGMEIAFNLHLAGAFSYYKSSVLHSAGFINERFRYAYDHVEHTYRIIKAGFHPSFWWFADLAGSEKMIADLDPQLANTVIDKRTLSWRLKLRGNTRLFAKLHGTVPAAIPDVPFETVEGELQQIRRQYGNRAGEGNN